MGGGRFKPKAKSQKLTAYFLYCVGCGLTHPSATAVAMEPVADIAGFASAILGSLQMLSGAVAGYLPSRVGGRDPHTLACVLAGAGVLALLLSAAEVRRHARA